MHLKKILPTLIYPALFILIIIAYWHVQQNGFVNFDDNEYVTENPAVQNGITINGIIWAFTAFHSNNWHPMTWLSHMLDCQLFGMNPGRHHLANVFFHIANALLLFYLFRRLTGNLWQSALISALFALHPIHVESVAWISERKDVLSTFFLMLTLIGYAKYVQDRSLPAYGAMLFVYALGLLSKPMLVTVPFMLLLLDYWPLRRFALIDLFRIRRLVIEKIPLFFLAVISCIMTYKAQAYGGAVKSIEFIPVSERVANAIVSYVSYIGKMIYPLNLSAIYVHKGMPPVWNILLSSLLLLLFTALILRSAKTRPYLFFGWFWFLGTLIPVIGLVQVGMQSMADRYTYIPLIGLFVIIAWGGSELLRPFRFKKIMAVTSVTLIFMAMIPLTYAQITTWKNDITLFEGALKVDPDNYIAHDSLGIALFRNRQLEEAVAHYRKAIQIKPDYKNPYFNLGVALHSLGKTGEAIDRYNEALKIEPRYADAHLNLGSALYQTGHLDEAISHYKKALELQPDMVKANYNMGVAFYDKRQWEDAIACFRETIKKWPDFADAHFKLGFSLYSEGLMNEAVAQYEKALQISPGNAEIHNNIGAALSKAGKSGEAIAHYKQALDINPNYAEAYNNLGAAVLNTGQLDAAIFCFQKALKINPDYVSANQNLANVLQVKKNLGENW